MTLKDTHTLVWQAIVSRLTEAVSDPSPRLAVKTFSPIRRQKSAVQRHPALYVLERRFESTDVGTNRSVGSITATFGVTESSFQQDTQSILEGIAFDVAELFLEDPVLGNLVNDTLLVSVEPDASPFGDEATELWSTVTLTWLFDYIRA